MTDADLLAARLTDQGPEGFQLSNDGPLGPNLELPGRGDRPLVGPDLEVLRNFGYERGHWRAWHRGPADLGHGGTTSYMYAFQFRDGDARANYLSATSATSQLQPNDARRFVLDDLPQVMGTALRQGIHGGRRWYNVQGTVAVDEIQVGIGVEGVDTADEGVQIIAEIAHRQLGYATTS